MMDFPSKFHLKSNFFGKRSNVIFPHIIAMQTQILFLMNMNTTTYFLHFQNYLQ